MTCAGCFHEKEVHDGPFCKGSVGCMCQYYLEPLTEFLSQLTETVVHFKATEAKVKYILEKIPGLRNAGSKSFPRAYKKIVYNINQNEPIPRGLWKTIPSDDTITRCKRKVQHDNTHLAKFDIHKIRNDMATQQGILEWVTGFDE